MSKQWPDKASREDYEIAGFIKAYAKLHGCTYAVEVKREKPDYWLHCAAVEPIAVELTSVYLSNRSVPERHFFSGLLHIPDEPETIDLYLARLAQAVREKSLKAAAGYDLSRRLVLSVYVNEYESIYLEPSDLSLMVRSHEETFRLMSPISEVVFWSLQNDGVYSITAAELAEQALRGDSRKPARASS